MPGQVIQGRKANGTYAPILVDEDGAVLTSGGGGEWTVLVDEDIAGNTDFETFAVTTTDYSRIRIRLDAPSVTANADTSAVLRFNGDSGNNYTTTRALYDSTSTTLTVSNQQNVGYMRIYSYGGDGIICRVEISNPSTGWKLMTGSTVTAFATGASAAGGQLSGFWKSNDKITSVSISPSATGVSGANAFPAGTRFIIEGGN